MLKRRLPNLVNYFRHAITNATSEGFQSVIQARTSAARGVRSFQNSTAQLLFFCLKPYPRPRLPFH